MQASYPTLIECRYRKSEKIFAIDRGATVLDSVLKCPHPTLSLRERRTQIAGVLGIREGDRTR